MQQELKIIVKADGTATVTRQLDGVTQAANKASAAGKKLSLGKEFMGGMVTGALTAAAAYLSVRAAINTANRALSEFTDAFTAMREVQATLTSTGRAAEFTTAQLADMAGELQQLTGIGDEEILRGATIGLLRFDAITKEMFPRVQRLALDMSKSMGGVENATRTLGISIADPILGMTRLRRAGIMLDQDQQALIKTLIETGKTAEAQGVLLAALESKYGGLAQAGVTGAVMLKTAWGEYLEAMGGSISALDGVKRGLAQFFFDVANDSQNLSQTQMKHILDVQERWAIFTLEAAQRGKQAITIMGGVAVSIFGLLQDTLNAVYYSFNNVYQAFISVFNGLGKIAPRFMEAITGVSTFKEAFNDLRDDFTIGSKKMVSIDAFGESSQKNLKNWIALFGNANTSIQQGTQDINAFYDAQRKLVESGKNPFTGMDMGEGESAAGLMQQIDAAQKAQTESVRDMQGDMLSAWAAYYTSLDEYSNDSIQAQADLYKKQLQDQYGTILSMTQIDEMYNAKLWELRDKQLAHFAENYEAMPEIAKTAWQQMRDAAVNAAEDMDRSAFNLLQDSLTDVMANTNNLSNVWHAAMESMARIALEALSKIIAKLIYTIYLQRILAAGKWFLGLFSGPAGMALGAGAGDLPPSIGFTSVNPGLGSLPSGINSNAELMSLMRDMRNQMANQNPSFNLYMDGVPLRNALRRTERRINPLAIAR